MAIGERNAIHLTELQSMDCKRDFALLCTHTKSAGRGSPRPVREPYPLPPRRSRRQLETQRLQAAHRT